MGFTLYRHDGSTRELRVFERDENNQLLAVIKDVDLSQYHQITKALDALYDSAYRQGKIHVLDAINKAADAIRV